MWVSVLKKQGMFRIGMGFESAQVSARDGIRHETSFGSERVQFKLSFGPRRVSKQRRFWIGTVRSDRHGFLHGTGFRSQQVLGRHEFPHETCFGSGRVSYRFDANRFDANRFDPYRFDPNHFDQYRFDANRFDANCFDEYRFDANRFESNHFDANRFDAYHFDANRLTRTVSNQTKLPLDVQSL
ncbi:hypothetical protein HanRHA438_Chr03g0142341 [Helianthus annuus]|nr:hypothetical protein HanRHA438_Chr03g0142341 [Helianthus annuus]